MGQKYVLSSTEDLSYVQPELQGFLATQELTQ
jgi:hypothetical protein